MNMQDDIAYNIVLEAIMLSWMRNIMEEECVYDPILCALKTRAR